ncbi:MAG: HD domain-containing protein [Actinomycetia bacterium]|nr:HD domain-containing protein [Actinomycetes bacterium]
MTSEAPTYRKLSAELQERIRADQAAHRLSTWRAVDAAARRRDATRDHANLWRPAYVRDVEKILHSAYYNRYSDKTQVFSLYKNDDLTRRALHVQLVSRAARTIGSVLGLNLDLIEAIALGHDIGHTPFGHAGERFLNELYHQRTGRYFQHNVHSVRVLDAIFNYNLSLQTLDGILCHNGEFGHRAYLPPPLGDFAAFDQLVEECYQQPERTSSLVAATLEGCVVRICDMIAYVGKDRQDAAKVLEWMDQPNYSERSSGSNNAMIINNLTVDIIEQSYGTNSIQLSEASWQDLEAIKRENYQLLYDNPVINRFNEQRVRPLFADVYERLLSDLERGDENSIIWRHHVRFVEQARRYYSNGDYLALTPPDQVVVDFIASMTDDYFIDLYQYLFPERDTGLHYIPYFKDAPQLNLGL